MLISPESIKFENSNDIVDYIGYGLPPTKSNYEKIVDKILNPDANDTVDTNDTVTIPNKIFNNVDTETFLNTLDRVYDNRIKNRNNTLIAAGVSILVGGIIALFKWKK